ncbi:MAG: DUF3014 domain-containing protein [Thermoanaerobaculia bacterium]|nr:DUF3014 domain-containing protein [Thermoanaerobaculia bacterium]
MRDFEEVEIERVEDEAGGEPPEERRMGSWALAAAVALLIAVVGVGWWVLRRQPAAAPAPAADAAAAAAIAPAEESELSAEPVAADPPLALPALGASDALMRQLVAGLSAHPQLVAWLAPEELVRRFVAAVVSVAEGESPAGHVRFLAPAAPFAVAARGGRTFLDPAGYRRYDLLAEVFVSLDTEGTARLYRQLRPLCDEALRELGYPGGRFDDFLARAIGRMLRVPPLERAPELEPRVVSHAFADPELEALSPADKHLLRFGPDNARRVQEKLRALAAAVPLRVRHENP